MAVGLNRCSCSIFAYSKFGTNKNIIFFICCLSKVKIKLQYISKHYIKNRQVIKEQAMKKQEVEFERCIEFLSRMIEKYGAELNEELSKEKQRIRRE